MIDKICLPLHQAEVDQHEEITGTKEQHGYARYKGGRHCSKIITTILVKLQNFKGLKKKKDRYTGQKFRMTLDSFIETITEVTEIYRHRSEVKMYWSLVIRNKGNKKLIFIHTRNLKMERGLGKGSFEGRKVLGEVKWEITK